MNTSCKRKKEKATDENTLTLIFPTSEDGFKYNTSNNAPETIFRRHELSDFLSSEIREKGQALKLVVVKCPLFTKSDVNELVKLLKKKNITQYVIKDANEKDIELYIRFVKEYHLQPTIDLNKFKESNDLVSISDSYKLTCLLTRKDSVYSYFGNSIKSGNFHILTDSNSYRAYLKKAKKEIGDSLFVILKQFDEANYRNLVKALDEMQIIKIKRYTLNKPSDEEIRLIKKS